MNSYVFGVILTFMSGIFWGFGGACAEYLFEIKRIDPDWVTTSRLLCSGFLITIPLAIIKRGRIFHILKQKSSILQLLFFSFFGLMMCQYTFFITIDLSNAAVATALQYTAPAMILLYVSFKSRKFPAKKEILALLCAIFGVFFLSTHGNMDSFFIPPKAIVVGLISAVMVAIYSIAPISLNRKFGVLTTLGISLIIGGIFSIFITKIWNLNGVDDFYGLLAMCGIVIFGTVLSFSFFLFGVTIIGPSRASLIASIEPIAAAIFIYFWFGVKFVLIDYVGFFLIILCTILLSKK